MVDFLLIFTRFLSADDADQVLAAPGEHDTVDLCANPAQRNPPQFPVVFAVVDALQPLVGKDGGGGEKGDSVFFKVALSFRLIPFELQLGFVHRTLFYCRHKCVHAATRQFSMRIFSLPGWPTPSAFVFSP